MKKLDIIILASILALSLTFTAVFFFVFNGKGAVAVVTVDGDEYARLPLSDDTELVVSTNYGTNTVIVQNEQVYIKDADCPDKICVKTGRASETKTIICLPHRLTVQIETEGR